MGSARAVARRFGVSASCAITLVGRWRKTGSSTTSRHKNAETSSDMPDTIGINPDML